MLPKAKRLLKDQDFKRLARQGRPFYNRALTVKVRLNKLKESRFGFVISTKVDKRATVRNQLRRRWREIVRLNLGHMNPGYDIMMIAKPAATKLNYQELTEQTLDLLARAKVYQNNV